MKKLLLIFAATALFVSCDPVRNDWSWKIKNSTDQTLTLEFFDFILYEPTYNTRSLIPGESILLDEVGLNSRDFNDYFKKSVRAYGEDVYWRILSDNNVVLKSWNYSDRNLPNQRFFEESEWQYNQEPGGAFVLMEYSWTFEILPEDITS
jgi:hypothetical protein